MMRFSPYILLILIIPILNSCFTEQRLAYRYEKELSKTSILFKNSADIFLTNSKVSIPSKLNVEEKDFLYDSAFYASDLIQHIDINEFKNQFGKFFIKPLNDSRFHIFPADSIARFIMQDRPRIIVDIVQIEVEENYDYYYDNIEEDPLYLKQGKYLHIKEANEHIEEINEHINDFRGLAKETYDIEILRNALTINMWLKIDLWLEDSTYSTNMIFLDYNIFDKIEGVFTWKYTDKVNYIYTIDSLDVNELWKAEEYPAIELGNASINFIINTVIDNRYNAKYNSSTNNYWQYSSKSKKIIPTNKEPNYQVLE